jgi:hypothetical protein
MAHPRAFEIRPSSRRRAVRTVFAALVVVAIIPPMYRRIDRDITNAELVRALFACDAGRAIAALDGGANPSLIAARPVPAPGSVVERILSVLTVTRTAVGERNAVPALMLAVDPAVADNRALGAKTSPSVVAALIRHGAHVDARSVTGVAALQLAAACRRPVLATLLLDHGADPNTRDDFGITPLQRAARAADPKCIRVLLAHHADPNPRTSMLPTPLK